MIKKFKSVTPSLRHRLIITHPKKPSFFYKYLIKGLSSKGGRNNSGKITIRHRGGKNKAKRNIRIIDFMRNIGLFSKCEVLNIEYNPHTSGLIASVKPIINSNNTDNTFLKNLKVKENKNVFYILAPKNLKKGDVILGPEYKKIMNIYDLIEHIKNKKNSPYFINGSDKLNKDVFEEIKNKTVNNLVTKEEIENNIKQNWSLQDGSQQQLKNIPVGTSIYNVQLKNISMDNINNFTLNPIGQTKIKYNKIKSIKNKLDVELNDRFRLYSFTNFFNKTHQKFNGKLARSAGTYCTLIKTLKTYNNEGKIIEERSIIRLPSKKLISVSSDCYATIGQVSNENHNLIIKGKAGVNRWLGKRPHVRGEAQNPVDHPHGGKSHGSGGLGNPAKTKFGKLAKWQKNKKLK